VQLLDPVTLGGRAVANRLVFGPHETNLGRGRALSERHVAYYARRARGGCGLIVTEIASVHPLDWPYERAPLAAECGPGWSDVVAACPGATVLAGLGHAGLQGSSAYSQRELWAPSPVPEVAGREVPKEMEDEDIADVVAGFAAATRIAMDAGCAGVEINAGQHSLIRQFLSGLTNLRGDDYGSDKVRFAREVLAAVRVEAGKFGKTGIVGIRLSCDELAPWAGLTPESATAVAAQLADAGLVDYVAVVRGSIFSVAATRPDGHTPPAFNADLARAVRAGISVPVVLQGSVVDLVDAEAALTSGAADLVEMTRAQLADPDLARKAASGAIPRPCILCNQTCLVRDPRNMLVSCVAEPSAGYETQESDHIEAAHVLRDVLVVGAGPAGLETARAAAAAGHRVRVIDRAEHTGGAVRIAAAAAGRERLAALVDWLDAECRRAGVSIETGVEADAGYLDRAAAAGERIVLCTGGQTGARAYTLESESVSAAGSAVLGADELLAGHQALPEGPVCIWDPVGGPVGISVAETLAAAGIEVTLVTPDLLVGNELARSGDLAPAGTRLQAAGVTLIRRSVLRGVRPGVVDLTDRFTGEAREVKAALVVDAGHRLPADTLWRERPQWTRAGDAVAPRSIYEAVLEGRRAADHLAEASL
jgi:mycofactocin system FadH/OYE family oxidoreductase 1